MLLKALFRLLFAFWYDRCAAMVCHRDLTGGRDVKAAKLALQGVETRWTGYSAGIAIPAASFRKSTNNEEKRLQVEKMRVG
jgi:hypothetical protein